MRWIWVVVKERMEHGTPSTAFIDCFHGLAKIDSIMARRIGRGSQRQSRHSCQPSYKNKRCGNLFPAVANVEGLRNRHGISMLAGVGVVQVFVVWVHQEHTVHYPFVAFLLKYMFNWEDWIYEEELQKFICTRWNPSRLSTNKQGYGAFWVYGSIAPMLWCVGTTID